MTGNWNNFMAYIDSLQGPAERLSYSILKPIIMGKFNVISRYMEVRLSLTAAAKFETYPCVDALVSYISVVFWIVALGVYLIVSGARILKNINSGRDNLLTNFVYFDDLEEEVGSIDDAVYYILFFGLILGWYFYFTVFASYVILKHITWITCIFTIILTSGIFIPGAVLIHMGIHFVQYVRGAGRSTNLVFETMLDLVSVSVIMIRFFVQNIRFLFILLAFFELYEWILARVDLMAFEIFVTDMRWADFFKENYTGWQTQDLISYILIQWVSYLYYMGHLTLLFIAQLGVYFVLSFWLFFFLYTTFVIQPHDKYFLYKRAMC